MSDQGLLPCPFCGDVAYLDAAEVDDPSLEPEDREVVAWSVGCSCCVFHGPHSTEESAITAWNTRTPPTTGDNPDA